MNTPERLKYIRKYVKDSVLKTARLSQQDFANRLGVNVSIIKNIESGRQQSIPYELAEKIQHKYGVALHYTLTGEGSVFLEELVQASTGTHGRPHLRVIKTAQETKTEIIEEIGIEQKEVEILSDETLKNVAKKLGKSIKVEYIEDDKKTKTCEIYPDGRIEEKATIIKIPLRENEKPAIEEGCCFEAVPCYYDFDKRYLDDYGINPKYAEIIAIHGNSMSPVLNDLDRVIVDRSKKEIIDGKIYYIRVGSTVKVRYVQAISEGIKLFCANPDFDNEYPKNWKIIGRVITIVGRSFL